MYECARYACELIMLIYYDIWNLNKSIKFKPKYEEGNKIEENENKI